MVLHAEVLDEKLIEKKVEYLLKPKRHVHNLVLKLEYLLKVLSRKSVATLLAKCFKLKGY